MANSHSFHHSEVAPASDGAASLPQGYGDNRIVIMARDPFWFFAYWEITADKAEAIRVEHGRNSWDESVMILRVYDLGESPETPLDSCSSFDVEVQKFSQQWYVQVPTSGHIYVVDLGLRWPDGKFVSLFRSNVVRQPSGRVSDRIDSEWMSVGMNAKDWELMALQAIGAGSSKGMSGEARKGLELRWEYLRSIFSGSVTSWRPQEPKS